ncbi:MAG: hypothetical protein IPO91_26560 [Chloroflexi bacterium]|nr:hypothetical protein [Chloroflexota bacterium]
MYEKPSQLRSKAKASATSCPVAPRHAPLMAAANGLVRHSTKIATMSRINAPIGSKRRPPTIINPATSSAATTISGSGGREGVMRHASSTKRISAKPMISALMTASAALSSRVTGSVLGRLNHHPASTSVRVSVGKMKSLKRIGRNG